MAESDLDLHTPLPRNQPPCRNRPASLFHHRKEILRARRRYIHGMKKQTELQSLQLLPEREDSLEALSLTFLRLLLLHPVSADRLLSGDPSERERFWKAFDAAAQPPEHSSRLNLMAVDQPVIG